MTRYGLDDLGIESRLEARFSAPVQTGPGGPTQSPVQCVPGLSWGVKSGRGVTQTPHPLLVLLVMKEQSYTCTPPMGRTACIERQCLYKGALYLFLLLKGENLTFRGNPTTLCFLNLTFCCR